MDSDEQRAKLREEANALIYVIRDMDLLLAYRSIDPGVGMFLRARYANRLQAVFAESGTPQTAPQTLSAAPPPPPPPVARPVPAPMVPSPPVVRPSLTRFAADNAILMVSSIGGVLLILAALLFELYGAGTFGEWSRFVAVGAVTVTFGAAARFAWRRETLRIVGKTYLAVFALLVPITMAAAYEFLPLRQFGLTGNLTAAFAGLSCAVLYTMLALSIRSKEYAALGVVAASVGWGAALNVAELGNWWGAGFGLAAVAISAIDRLPLGNAWRQLLAKTNATLAGTAFVVAGGVSFAFAVSTWWLGAGPWRAPWVIFTLASAIAALAVRRSAVKEPMVATILATATLTATAICWSAGASSTAYAITWVGAAAVWAVADRFMLRVAGLLPIGASALMIMAALMTPVDDAIELVVLATAALTSLVLSWPQRQNRWFAGAYVAALLIAAEVSPQLFAPGASGHPLFAVALLVLTACSAVATWGRWNREMVAATSLALNASLLAFNHSFNGGWLGAAWFELGSGVVYVAAGTLLNVPQRLRVSLSAFGLLHLSAALVMPYGGNLAHALVAVVACSTAVLPAVTWRKPALTYVPAALLAIGWYWIVPAVVPPPPNPGASTLALAYSPLVVIMALAGGVLWLTTAREHRWSVPVEITALAVGLWTLLLAATGNSATLLAVDLLIFGLVVYAAGVWENWSPAVWISAVLLELGVVSGLGQLGAPSHLYPIATALTGAGFYITGWVFPPLSAWSKAHRGAGMTAAATSAILPWFIASGLASVTSQFDLAEALAAVALAACLFIECQGDPERPLFWGGVGVLSLACDWLPAAASWGNPQAYIAVPSVVAMASGWYLMQKRRSWLSSDGAAAIAAAGCALLLGTTVLQSFSDDMAASTYSVAGVIEAVALFLLGIGFAHRACVVIGVAGLGLLGMHALYQVIQTVPLYAVFAVAATVLILIGALMATARPHIAAWRDAAAHSWQSWH